jgi:hypothetical protein
MEISLSFLALPASFNIITARAKVAFLIFLILKKKGLGWGISSLCADTSPRPLLE